MRTTKTLLIAAAALAATVTASKAQTVYSQNVVGYVNVTCNHGFTLLANQLDLGPGSNNVNKVLVSGPVSATAPNGYAETSIAVWNGTQFTSYYYLNTSDAGGPAGYEGSLGPGWYNSSYSALCTNTLSPSQAVFVGNSGANPITITLTGQVDQGTNQWATVTPGANFYSEPAPLAGTPLDSTNINFPAVSSFDSYSLYTGTGYSGALYYLNTTDAGGPLGVNGSLGPGWYNSSYSVNEDTNASVWPSVGQGFLVIHANKTSSWTNVFEVQ